MSDELIRMLNGPIDKERALARLWGEYDLAKDAESDTDSDSTGGDGAPFPGYTFPGTWSCHGGMFTLLPHSITMTLYISYLCNALQVNKKILSYLIVLSKCKCRACTAIFKFYSMYTVKLFYQLQQQLFCTSNVQLYHNMYCMRVECECSLMQLLWIYFL